MTRTLSNSSEPHRFNKPVKWYEISKGCEVGSSPGWAGNYAKEIMDWLMEEVDWQQRSIRVRGREIPQPRLIAYFATSSNLSYTYSGMKIVPHRLPPLLEELMGAVDKASGYPGYNSVLCNLYRDGGDCVGWHSDNERLYGEDPTIGSLSFGDPRDFILRKNSDHTRTHVYPLGHGDLLIMRGGTQRRWMHSVPKRMPASSCMPRVNLTFRKVVDPSARGTITPENSSSEEDEGPIRAHRPSAHRQQQQQNRRQGPEQGSWRRRPGQREEEEEERNENDEQDEEEVSDEDERQGRWGHRHFRQQQKQEGQSQQHHATRQQPEQRQEECHQQQGAGGNTKQQGRHKWQEAQQLEPRQQEHRRQEGRWATSSPQDVRAQELHAPSGSSSSGGTPWGPSSSSFASASAAARSAMAGMGRRGPRGLGAQGPAVRAQESPSLTNHRDDSIGGHEGRRGSAPGFTGGAGSGMGRRDARLQKEEGGQREAQGRQVNTGRPAPGWAPRSHARWNIDEEENEEEGDWEAEGRGGSPHNAATPSARATLPSAAPSSRDGRDSRARPTLVLGPVVAAIAVAAADRPGSGTPTQRGGTPPLSSGPRSTSAVRDPGAPPAAAGAGGSGSSSRLGDDSGGSKPPSPVPGSSAKRSLVRVPRINHQILAGRATPSPSRGVQVASPKATGPAGGSPQPPLQSAATFIHHCNSEAEQQRAETDTGAGHVQASPAPDTASTQEPHASHTRSSSGTSKQCSAQQKQKQQQRDSHAVATCSSGGSSQGEVARGSSSSASSQGEECPPGSGQRGTR